MMQVDFSGELIEWRGPAPFYWVSVPEQESQEIKEIAAMLTYGWGVIPVEVTIKHKTWTTSLMPKDGRYLVPIRNDVRVPLKISLGDILELTLDFGK